MKRWRRAILVVDLKASGAGSTSIAALGGVEAQLPALPNPLEIVAASPDGPRRVVMNMDNVLESAVTLRVTQVASAAELELFAIALMSNDEDAARDG